MSSPSLRSCARRAAGLALRSGVLAFAAVPAAHAYIDPGTGTMLLQVIGATVAGALFCLRELQLKLKSLFTRRSVSPVPDVSGDGSGR